MCRTPLGRIRLPGLVQRRAPALFRNRAPKAVSGRARQSVRAIIGSRRQRAEDCLPSDGLMRYRCIQLACALKVLFGQLGHTKVLEAATNHPVEKRVIGRELVSLPFMGVGFLVFT